MAISKGSFVSAGSDALTDYATHMIELGGCKVVRTENWGLRRLAYKIAKNRHAHYVMLNIDVPADVLTELDRQPSVDNDTIRFISVKGDELPLSPGPLFKRKVRLKSSDSDESDAVAAPAPIVDVAVSETLADKTYAGALSGLVVGGVLGFIVSATIGAFFGVIVGAVVGALVLPKLTTGRAPF